MLMPTQEREFRSVWERSTKSKCYGARNHSRCNYEFRHTCNYGAWWAMSLPFKSQFSGRTEVKITAEHSCCHFFVPSIFKLPSAFLNNFILWVWSSFATKRHWFLDIASWLLQKSFEKAGSSSKCLFFFLFTWTLFLLNLFWIAHSKLSQN